MQQRRLRPGDVVDDYCPRERRITDHAVVAMIDDNIKQTRCVVCDAEHEYKQGRIPPQRRKKAPAGLFNQVLDGLQAPARLAHPQDDTLDEPESTAESEPVPMPVMASDREAASVAVAAVEPSLMAVVSEPVMPVVPLTGPAEDSVEDVESERAREIGSIRRPLIRAALPRPEGQPPPTRAIPEFTIRQPMSRAGRPGGGRRRGQPSQQGFQGPMRFGRSGDGFGNGTGNGNGNGRGRGHGSGAQGNGNGSGHGRPNGQRNHGPNGGRPGGPRRGGKKR